jgi:pimeloyl-ACP methyl ester carboxylesterase
MAKALVNGMRFHYQTRGDGRDVILIHGVTSSLAVWYTKVQPSLASSFRVTAYDLRGHGLSDMPPTGYTSFDMAQDLAAFMDSVGIRSAAIVGHSFGGCIGLHFALLYPDRVDSLVLLDSGVACLRYMRTIKEWSGWTRLRRQLDRFGISYERFVNLDNKQDVSDIFRNTFKIPIQFGFRKGSTRATPRFQKLINETSIGKEFREPAGLTEERLPEVKIPVLALYGETSPYLKLGMHLTTVLPNCRQETLHEDGHFYLIRNPDAALDRISAFLADPHAYVRGSQSASLDAERRAASGDYLQR